MSMSSVQALREAGLVSGELPPALEDFYATLTEDEVSVLISTKTRLEAILPDVEAHSWNTPESTQEGFDAAMLCACSIWSGAGSASK